MTTKLGKHKSAIIILTAILLYFSLLTYISYQRAPAQYRIDENTPSLAEYQDFIVLAGEEGAYVGQDRLMFDSADSSAEVFAARLSLTDLQKISVQFSVDCPEEYAGTTLHVDLYDGEAYDAPEQEFFVVLAPGVNQINEVLDKGENAPEEAWLRIFTLEPAGYEIQNLRVCSINQSKNYTQIIVFCLALMLLAGAIILLLTRNNNATALVEVLTLNENVSLTIAQKWRGRITPALTIVILTACEWFFFRNVIGTESLIGDRGDGRLTMLLTEHWYHVFRGEAGIADLGIFYPSRNTLGYSDIFFGFGIIHSVLRLLGVDVFFSYKYTLIIVHLIGTITTYLLLRRFLNVDAGWSLFGTIAFSFSSSYAAHSCHTQLLCISLVPPFFCALTAFFQNIHDRKKRNRFAALAIALMLLFLYTAWYIFFFTALFLVLLLCVESILFASKGYKVRHGILDFLKLLNADIVYYFAAFFIGTVPFIALELPVLKMSGGRGYGEVRVFLPEVIDLINVDEGNWALGPLMKVMRLGERGYSGEVAIGFSLVLLLFFVVALIWFRKKIVLTGGTVEILTEGIALAVILSCVLPLRLSSNGVSLWWFVFNLFPGAASVRAAGRYLLYLSLPMAIITAVMGNELTKRNNNTAFKKISSCALLLLIFLAFVFNIRNDGVYSFWTREGEIQFLEAVAPPPDDCRVFYLTKSSPDGEPAYVLQLDAHEIADRFQINTINGYSGVFPSGWDGLWEVQGNRYESAVASWIEANHLENVYRYDKSVNEWAKYSPALIADACFDAENKLIPDLMDGLWDWEPQDNYSWTARDFSVTLLDKEITSNELLLKLGTTRDLYLMQQPDIEPECYLYVNGEQIQEIPVINGYAEYLIDVPENPEDLYHIELRTNCYFVPADVGINGDTRELSMQLYYLGATSV